MQKEQILKCAQWTLKMARVCAVLAVPCAAAVVIATVAVCHDVYEHWVTDFILCGGFGVMFFGVGAIGLTYLAKGDMEDYNTPDPDPDGEVQLQKAA